ncbi:MAG: hypothetical protein A2Z40_04330 [Deltaproteobacteria bacterium RBG_19FT_COMBO_60_16]|nr:MAG: hypothetical protein A2Z40_04330 [Deltaproteobacteria bacterium RBG_19FT_COMBO_60_16]
MKLSFGENPRTRERPQRAHRLEAGQGRPGGSRYGMAIRKTRVDRVVGQAPMPCTACLRKCCDTGTRNAEGASL